MNRQRLLVALASVLTGITVLLVMLGIVYNLIIVIFAVPFAAAAYILWYHATGRLEAQARRRPFDPWQRRVGPEQRAAGDRRQRATGDPRFNGGWSREWEPDGPDRGLSDHEAYQRLDLEPGANQERVRQAYRRKVKDVHPDREGGDEKSFREVRQAYDRLSEKGS